MELSERADLRIRSLLLECEFEETGIFDNASRDVRGICVEGRLLWLAWWLVLVADC